MPSTRREPGTGRRRPRNVDAGAPRRRLHRTPTRTTRPGWRGGPMAPLESSGDGLEEAAIFARSSYSPLDGRRGRRARVDARRARLARCRAIVRAPAASGPVAPLAAGAPGTTLRPSTHAARQPADRRRGADAALAAPPAAGAAIRAAGRRQPLDERPRTDRAADRGGHGERHDAGRGVHVLDGAPARDRRRAARGGGGERAVSIACIMRGRAAPASARASASSCGGSASAWWDATPS